VGPKSITVGTPVAAAAWHSPLSFPTTTPAEDIISTQRRSVNVSTKDRT